MEACSKYKTQAIMNNNKFTERVNTYLFGSPNCGYVYGGVDNIIEMEKCIFTYLTLNNE